MTFASCSSCRLFDACLANFIIVTDLTSTAKLIGSNRKKENPRRLKVRILVGSSSHNEHMSMRIRS
jgi:hypothetical protein